MSKWRESDRKFVLEHMRRSEEETLVCREVSTERLAIIAQRGGLKRVLELLDDLAGCEDAQPWQCGLFNCQREARLLLEKLGGVE